jgi:hypothetical protein
VPLWWLRRAAVDAEIRRSEELDLRVISVVGVMRLAAMMRRDAELPSPLRAAISELDRELAGVEVAHREQ